MTSTFSCLTINDLAEFTFIAGTKQLITYNIYDENAQPVDLSTCTCSLVISPYGQPNYAVVTKTGSISGSPVNQFTANLLSTDTLTLSGKYVQQPVIVDNSGVEFRPSQGIITIIPRIATI